MRALEPVAARFSQRRILSAPQVMLTGKAAGLYFPALSYGLRAAGVL